MTYDTDRCFASSKEVEKTLTQPLPEGEGFLWTAVCNMPTQDNTERARQLRKDSTFPERLLWGSLRAGKLAGLKFRRQHPIGPYVADFCCNEAALVVELDGISHDGRRMEDERRTEYLRASGFKVVRFSNDEVIQDLEAVLMAIARAAVKRIE